MELPQGICHGVPAPEVLAHLATTDDLCGFWIGYAAAGAACALLLLFEFICLG